jgi:signal transduction histidine kinase/ligand-binding sensor domain-containing protein
MPRFFLKKATPLHFEGRGGRRSRPGWVAFRNPFSDHTIGRASGAARHLHSSKSAKGVPNGRNQPKACLTAEIHQRCAFGRNPPGAAPAAQPDTFILRNPLLAAPAEQPDMKEAPKNRTEIINDSKIYDIGQQSCLRIDYLRGIIPIPHHLPGFKMLVATRFHKITFWGMLFLVLVIAGGTLSAQQLYGNPMIHTFLPEEYNAHPQNWCIDQTQYGHIIIGNNDGLLIYDGARWELHSFPDLIRITAIKIDQNERIWIGSHRDFGYVEKDGNGGFGFHSLLEKLPDTERQISPVIEIYQNDQGIIFNSENGLYVLADSQLAVVEAEGEISKGGMYQGVYHVQVRDIGICKLSDGKLTLIEEGWRFKNARIYGMLHISPAEVLIPTFADGLFRYDGKLFHRFKTDVDPFIKKHFIHSGIKQLHNGNILLGTMNGFVIISKEGRFVAHCGEESGLHNKNVFFMHEDHLGNIWAVQENAISMVEFNSPFTFYQRGKSARTLVLDIEKVDNEIYLATFNGLYRLGLGEASADGIRNAKFLPTSMLGLSIWDLQNYDDELIIPLYSGCYAYQKGESQKISPLLFHKYAQLRSRRDPQRIFIGGETGLMSIYKQNDGWQDEGFLLNTPRDIYYLEEDDTGHLWAATLDGRVYRFSFSCHNNRIDTSKTRTKTFASEALVTDGTDTDLTWFRNTLYMGSDKGLHQYDPATEQFNKVDFGSDFLREAAVVRLDKLNDSTMWVHRRNDRTTAFFTFSGDSVVCTTRPFRRLKKFGIMLSVFQGDDSTYWIGTEQALVRYEAAKDAPAKPDFQAFVHKVSANSDSVIYHWQNKNSKLASGALAYQLNTLRFEYAAPAYGAQEEVLYQTYLKGFDDDWQPWTGEIQRDFTRMAEGDYEFRVRAKNIYGQISSAGIYRFTITPPFYRSLLAYILYILLLGALIYAIVRLRSLYLQRDNERLETLVQQRSKELEEAQRLLFQNEKMSALGQMVAGIAHEVNSPRAAASNYLFALEKEIKKIGTEEQVQKLPSSKITHELIPKIQHSLDRIGEIIAELLNFARLDDRGKKKSDISQIIDSALIILQTKLENRVEVKLNFNHQRSLQCWPGLLNQAFLNILLNAAEAIDGKGQIEVQTGESNGHQTIAIIDNGTGVKEKNLPYIFEPFFTTKKVGEGTGLGLSIAYKIIHKHNGTIKAENHPGGGFKVTVDLPVE